MENSLFNFPKSGQVLHVRVMKMQSNYLEEFLESLKKFGSLYGPQWKGDVLTFDHLERIDSLYLGDDKPMIPIKKLFHPKRFNMFHFSEEGFTPDYSMVEKRVVLGLHPCEIHSLLRLDEVFLGEPVDPYYAALRENSAIVGFSCMPTENCLCNSTGTDMVEEGFDLFFIELDDFYLVWIGSSLGHNMVFQKEQFFDENVTEEDIRTYIKWRDMRNASFEKAFCFRNMPGIIEMSHNSEKWDEFAEKCLSCGQCTMVCPTCNCYNTEDIFDVTQEVSGRRERVWDSCMFQDYSLVAGGHNFRGARVDRLKLWYSHKLKSFGHEYGRPACIGCGRCVENCPVDINVLTVSEAFGSCEEVS